MNSLPPSSFLHRKFIYSKFILINMIEIEREYRQFGRRLYSEIRGPKGNRKEKIYEGVPNKEYGALTDLVTIFMRSPVPIFPALCPNCNSARVTVIMGIATQLKCLDCGKEYRMIEREKDNRGRKRGRGGETLAKKGGSRHVAQ